jgi:sortase (surface protein transpeptidase)
MVFLTHARLRGSLLIVLFLAAMLVGCENREMEEVLQIDTPSLLILPTDEPIIHNNNLPSEQPTIQLTSTKVVLGSLFDPSLDLMADPVPVPLELEIPYLKVKAPVVGVGLTKDYLMDAPKGDIGDPIWHTAFWYRGSGIPGEPGTATIAGHVNDPLGRFEIFARLEDLDPGDLIIVRYTELDIDIRFKVDQVKVYSVQESSKPEVLSQIYGEGPVSGTGPQPSIDGSSRLTLITCAGNIVNGQFDHHIVVFATRTN